MPRSLPTGRGARAARPSGCFPTHLPGLRYTATHGGTQSVAAIAKISLHTNAAHINGGSRDQWRPRDRCTGSTGLAGSPRRPRIMEGPLVSDTTEILGGGPTASEDAPAAAGATAPTSKSRSRGGPGLSSLLMPELQRIAQTLAIPGAGRMRKSQLIEAIEARQVGGGRQETSAARRGSDQRAASAGADATRPLKQDAMEADAFTRPGIGDGAQAGLGDAAPRRHRRGRSRAAAAQLLRGGRNGRPPGQRSPGGRSPGQRSPQWRSPQRRGPRQRSPRQRSPRRLGQDGSAQDDTTPSAAAGAAQADTQRGDRRRRNGQPSRGRDQTTREQSGRDGASRDSASRDSAAETATRPVTG